MTKQDIQDRDRRDQESVEGLRKLLRSNPYELAYFISPNLNEIKRVKALLTEDECARVRFGRHDFKYGELYDRQ